jgi:hypothetical protein
MPIINDVYSPDTGEHIATDNPAAWMRKAGVSAPAYNKTTEGCFWKNGAWLVVSAAPAILESAQLTQNSALDQAYNAAIQLPVAYMATSFQADSASQDVLTKSLAPGSVPTGFAWLDANNVAVPMTFAQLQGLAAAMLARGWAAFQNLQTRKIAVRDATTVAQVQAIIW